MNVMHSSMKITDEFYSNLTDGEVQNRISSLGKALATDNENKEAESLIKEFLIWKKKTYR